VSAAVKLREGIGQTQPKVKHENPASLAIVTGFDYRQRWGAWQVRKEFHTIFLVNPNRLAVRAIHAREKAVMRCAKKYHNC